MEYGPFDSSGTDDDLLPNYHNRVTRVPGNGWSSCGGHSQNLMQNDMETQIHQIEKDAYCAVLRAFKAQADAITWDKEGLITELRKELRVSNEEHRELLARVNADDVIHRIRAWRESGGGRPGFALDAPVVHEPIYGPCISASRKRQRLPKAAAPLAFDAPLQPCFTVIRTGDPLLASKSRALPGAALRKSACPPATGLVGSNQTTSQGFHSSLTALDLAKSTSIDPLIGRKVFVRLHGETDFYAAVVSDSNPREGLHALVYDIGTVNETVEWVNLKEISPEDIRWGDEHPRLSHGADSGPTGFEVRPAIGQGRVTSGAKGRGTIKILSKKDYPFPQGPQGPQQNTTEGERLDGEVRLPIVETMIKEVEELLNSSYPDPLEIEKAKKYLRDHEQCLVNVLARLDASDIENDGQHPRMCDQQPQTIIKESGAKKSGEPPLT